MSEPTLTKEQLKELMGPEEFAKFENLDATVQEIVSNALAAEEAKKQEAKKKEEEAKRLADLSEVEKLKEELAAERQKNEKFMQDFQAFKEEFTTSRNVELEKLKAANAAALAELPEVDQNFVKQFGGDDEKRVAEMIAAVKARGGTQTPGSQRQTSRLKHDLPPDKTGGQNNPPPKEEPVSLEQAERRLAAKLNEVNLFE